MVIGGLAAFILALIFITFRFLGDDTLRTQEDIARCLGIETLGTIPFAKSEAEIGESVLPGKRERTDSGVSSRGFCGVLPGEPGKK